MRPAVARDDACGVPRMLIPIVGRGLDPAAGPVGCRLLPEFGFLPFLFVTEKEPKRSRWFRMQRTHDQRGFPPLESPEAGYRPGVWAGTIPRPPDGRHLAAPSMLTPRCAPLRAGRGKPFRRHLRNE